jgi:hypothetical protein
MTLRQSLKMKISFSSVVEKNGGQMGLHTTLWYLLSRPISDELEVEINLSKDWVVSGLNRMENLKNTQMLNESVLLKTTPFKTCDIMKYHKLAQITD